MRKIFFSVLVTVLFLLPLSSYGFSEKGQECSKCHTLTKDEATVLLKDLIPNLKIIEIRESPVKGMWEVDVEAGGRKGPTYVDFSKKHFFAGSIIEIKDKRNLTQERLVDLTKVDVSQIPLDDALLLGEKDAKHKLIVFDDPD